MGRLLFLLLAFGVLTNACGSAEHIQIPPTEDDEPTVDFQSKVNVCPAFRGSSANPTEIAPADSARITVLADDPDGLDSALQFQWSAESGTFSEPTRSLTDYRCGKPGTQLLQVVAKDSGGCSSALSVNVNCLAH